MLKNASQPAKVYYGMHFEPGTAQYAEPGKEPYKILINEETIREMNKTFAGKPVYVDHVDSVDLKNVENEAAGWVVESFYNKLDGKTWCKFIIVSDEGFAAISRGWKLSNAYVPTGFGSGGTWHGMLYEKEVTNGVYEHLAIVENPRYEASVILDVDQFKEYNANLEQSFLKIANSKEKKGEKKMGISKYFKREKIENDLDGVMVTLTKSNKDVSISEAVELADKYVNMSGYASDDHMVKLNDDEEMSVNDLRDCYNKRKNEDEEMKKKNAESEEEKKKNEEEEKKKENDQKDGVTKSTFDEIKANEEKEEEKKENEEEKEGELEKKQNMMHFNNIKNAMFGADFEDTIILNSDRVELGKKLFGSDK